MSLSCFDGGKLQKATADDLFLNLVFAEAANNHCLSNKQHNKPLEWTGRPKFSTTPPQAACLPLRGTFIPAQQPKTPPPADRKPAQSPSTALCLSPPARQREFPAVAISAPGRAARHKPATRLVLLPLGSSPESAAHQSGGPDPHP